MLSLKKLRKVIRKINRKSVQLVKVFSFNHFSGEISNFLRHLFVKEWIYINLKSCDSTLCFSQFQEGQMVQCEFIAKGLILQSEFVCKKKKEFFDLNKFRNRTSALSWSILSLNKYILAVSSYCLSYWSALKLEFLFELLQFVTLLQSLQQLLGYRVFKDVENSTNHWSGYLYPKQRLTTVSTPLLPGDFSVVAVKISPLK